MFRTDGYERIPELHEIDTLFDLREKVAVITGGAGKMAEQFAYTLAGAGASVALADLNGRRCDMLAEEISCRTGSNAKGFRCDVTDQRDIRSLFKAVAEGMGPPDILVFNVMAKPRGYYKPPERYTLKAWKEVLDGNLTGAFLCSREAAKYMKENGGGAIVLTSSVYGIVGPDQRIYRECCASNNIYGGGEPLNCPAPYSASKAGLNGLARHLATLWGIYNIRINVLVPGGVYDGQEEAFHRSYVNRTPIGRMAVWSDFNGAILFLVSDASRYMTGATLVVDGGWTAW